MKRIAMIVHACYLRDARVRRYAEALSCLHHKVDVFCVKEKGEISYEVVNGVKVFRIPVHRLRGQKLSYFVEYALSILLFGVYVSVHHLRKRYEIVHVHNMPDLLVLSALFPKASGAKIVLDLHDPMPEQFMSMFNKSRNYPIVALLKLCEALSFAVADRLITVEDSFREIFVSRHRRVKEKMIIVRNIPDQKIFRKKVPKSTKRKGIHLLYLGTLAPRYRIEDIFAALLIVRKQINDVHFSICAKLTNEGRYGSYLRRRAWQLGIHEIVSFHSPVSIHEVPELMGRHDIGISLAKRDCYMDYILPLKLMEYASQGMAIIASRQPTICRYFGEFGVRYVESGDIDGLASAITELANDTEGRKILGGNARKVISKYPWSNELKKYLVMLS